MALIVQKYGGSSVANAKRIRHVAKRVIKTKKAGNQVVVVVSDVVEVAGRCAWDDVTAPGLAASGRFGRPRSCRGFADRFQLGLAVGNREAADDLQLRGVRGVFV